MLNVEWYHVCWPRLTAKRVEPVVSISWASCFTTQIRIYLLLHFDLCEGIDHARGRLLTGKGAASDRQGGALSGRPVDPQLVDDDHVGHSHDGHRQEEQDDRYERVVELAYRKARSPVLTHVRPRVFTPAESDTNICVRRLDMHVTRDGRPHMFPHIDQRE